jgi:hypothetical protein
VSDKTEQWAWQRIQVLEHRIDVLCRRVTELQNSRDLWRKRANDPKLKGRWRKRVKR